MLKDKRTLIKIAYYYYKLGMTQGEIAKKLSISRQKVNRSISSLVAEGIVTITINGYENLYIDLEQELEDQFGLKEVIVTTNLDGQDSIPKIGIAGANYLEKIITDESVIGVSWGRTLSAVASNLPTTLKKNVSVVQLVGGMNLKNVSIKADEITRSIAHAFAGTPYLMYAPAIVKDANLREAILSDQSFEDTFEMIKKCNIAVVGIGALNQESTLFKENYLTQEDFTMLKEAKCVGDICSHYYDLNGEPFIGNINSRVIGPDIKELKQIELVIGLAAGEDKIDAIIGALAGDYLDVLITDHVTAEQIINQTK